MGDVVMTTPLFRELKRAFPKAHCTVVVRGAFRPLLVTNPHIDEILTLPELRVACLPRRARELVAVLLLYWRQFAQEALRYRHLAALGPRRAPGHPAVPADERHAARRLHREDIAAQDSGSTADSRQPSDICLTAGPVRHEVVRNLAVVEALGGTVQDSSLELRLTERDREFASQLLASVPAGTKVIAVGIGANTAGRRWPLECYAECVSRLAREVQVQPVILCSASERAQASQLAKLLHHEPIILSGAPLRKVCAVLERCDLFIGNDSGPAHLAAAMDCKTIVVSRHPQDGDPNHGNSPLRFAPYAEDVRVLTARDWTGLLHRLLPRAGAALHYSSPGRRSSCGCGDDAARRAGKVGRLRLGELSRNSI